MLKKIIVIIFIAITSFAQNSTPEVTNVQFLQRNDDSYIVDIYYDVNDFDGDSMEIWVEYSLDNGLTWTKCASVDGDIGTNILSGTQKHIIWNLAKDLPADTYSTESLIRVYADDGILCGETIFYAGKTYNTVQIGNQCWLKENLDVGTMINSNGITFQPHFEQTNNGVIEKYCYDNDPSNCEKYGGLYEWTEAMQYSTEEGAQGICPDGWHIPSRKEYITLKEFVTSKAEGLVDTSQSTDGYTPTNETGFSALFGGFRRDDGFFFNLFYQNDLWTSTEHSTSSGVAYYMEVRSNNIYVQDRNGRQQNGFSVRCIKDSP